MTLAEIKRRVESRLYVPPDELLRLIEEHERYRAALEWYADESRYWYGGELYDKETGQMDEGNRARAALEGQPK